MSLLLILRGAATPVAPAPTDSGWTGPLRILGLAALGKTLTIDTSNFPGTFTYQWVRAAPPLPGRLPLYTSIPGATGTTYTLVAADVGKVISAVLT